LLLGIEIVDEFVCATLLVEDVVLENAQDPVLALVEPTALVPEGVQLVVSPLSKPPLLGD